MKLGYMRKSTSKESQLFRRQEVQLQDAGCEKIYRDTISGTKANKPELLKMIADIEAIRAQDEKEGTETPIEVVVVSIDRLGRSVSQVLDTVQTLDRLGVGLTSIKEGFQANNALGKFFVTMCAAFAELEVSMCRERVNDGLAAAKKRGVKLGRKPKNLDTAIRMYHSGEYSIKEICEANNICKQTLYNHLRKEEAKARIAAAE